MRKPLINKLEAGPALCGLICLLWALVIILGSGCTTLTLSQKRAWLDKIQEEERQQEIIDRVTWVYKAR